MSEYILALDLGTSGCKAAIVDLQGVVHAWEFCKVETILQPGGGAEQNPADWWKAITTTCKALIDSGKVPAKSIIAVCANTQGEGTLPVDESGTPLSNAILWMDTRGADLVKKQVGGLINVSGYAPKKLYQFIKLTGGAPSLTGKDPVGHMLFIKHNWPEIYRKTHKFLNVLDYVNFKFTGKMVATVDSLMTSWVTDNRDPDSIKIDTNLCKIIGINENKIPTPVACTKVLGKVEKQIANSIGLDPDTVVVAGAIDTTAAALGAGTVNDGDIHLYLGTSGWLGAHVPFKKTDIISSIASLPCTVPSKYLMVALQATACGNLDFVVDKIIYNDDILPQIDRPEDMYLTLNKIAAESPAGSNGLIYTPWIYGERAPIENRHIRAGIHNLSLEHTPSDIVRSILEGIALNTKWISLLTNLSKSRVKPFR